MLPTITEILKPLTLSDFLNFQLISHPKPLVTPTVTTKFKPLTVSDFQICHKFDIPNLNLRVGLRVRVVRLRLSVRGGGHGYDWVSGLR